MIIDEESLEINLLDIEDQSLQNIFVFYRLVLSRAPNNACIKVKLSKNRLGYLCELTVISLEFKLHIQKLGASLMGVLEASQGKFIQEINSWLKERLLDDLENDENSFKLSREQEKHGLRLIA